MMEVKLTKGFVALVDDEDYDRVSKFKWYACIRKLKSGNHVSARRAIYIEGKQKIINMHRFVLDILDNAILVDHVDRNPLNNSKANLRECTLSQNNANKTKVKNGTSKYFGVHKCSPGWVAQIRKHRVSTYLGYFREEKDAALAYNVAAKILHGEFANLNTL